MSSWVRLNSLTRKRVVYLGIAAIFVVFMISSYIVALLAFVAPSIDFPLKVLDVGTYDQGDNPSTSFSIDDRVYIKAQIEMATDYYEDSYYSPFVSDESYRALITVVDGDDKPVFFQYFSKDVSPGDDPQEINGDFLIKTSGSFTIRVMAWASSGEPLAPNVGEAVFTVDG